MTRFTTTLGAVLAALAGLVLFLFAASGSATAQGADDPGQVAAGQAIYEMNCAGCHAADGTGVAGRGRPLTGIAMQGDRATHIASITDGKGGMPAFGERLSADEIEQAASYVRLTFVSEEQAAEQPTELAMTGTESTLAVAGVVMIAAGAQLVVLGRRRSNR